MSTEKVRECYDLIARGLALVWTPSQGHIYFRGETLGKLRDFKSIYQSYINCREFTPAEGYVIERWLLDLEAELSK